LQPPRTHGARIDLDRVLAGIGELEVLAQRGDQLRQLVIGHEGRRAAAEVQVTHRLPAPGALGDQPDLALQRGQVGNRALDVLRADLVAGTVVADRATERDVHVETERLAAAPRALRERDGVAPRIHAVVEAVRRGIRGVAGALAAEAAQQLGIDDQRFLRTRLHACDYTPNFRRFSARAT